MSVLLQSAEAYKLSRSDVSFTRALRSILTSERRLVRQIGAAPPRRERRSDQRYHLQLPVYLRPVNVRGLTVTLRPDVPTLQAVTLNVSRNGLGLVHDAPLPGTLLLAEFDVGLEQPLALLFDVRWSQSSGPFEYRSGGLIQGICRPRE
jgi:hypothetical protein